MSCAVDSSAALAERLTAPPHTMSAFALSSRTVPTALSVAFVPADRARDAAPEVKLAAPSDDRATAPGVLTATSEEASSVMPPLTSTRAFPVARTSMSPPVVMFTPPADETEVTPPADRDTLCPALTTIAVATSTRVAPPEVSDTAEPVDRVTVLADVRRKGPPADKMSLSALDSPMRSSDVSTTPLGTETWAESAVSVNAPVTSTDAAPPADTLASAVARSVKSLAARMDTSPPDWVMKLGV